MSYDLTSYSGLKTSIANLLNRSDLTDYIDGFIDMFEADVDNDLRTVWQEATVDVTPSSGRITLPADFLNARQVRAKTNPTVNLTPTTLDFIDTRYRDRPSGTPRYYAVSNGTMLILPTTTSDIELTYYQEITKLSDANTTNWLLEMSPQMYLYGAAIHSAPLLHDDQRIQLWGQLHDIAKSSVEKRSKRMKYGSGVQRLKSVTP